MSKTKIVCTLGPSSEEVCVLQKMVSAGMKVARINLSHGNQEIHRKRMENIKEAARLQGNKVALLVDTRGPEIRIRSFKDGSAELKEGNFFTLTADEVDGDEKKVSVTYSGLPRDVSPGDTVLLDDGRISLKVVETTERDVECRVEFGGTLRDNKGMNLPGVHLDLPVLSEKDREDLLFALELGIDFIAASFVRNRQDVIDIRNLAENAGKGRVGIISKIENRQGLDNYSEILEGSDGIMVARGDLGVEIPVEEVPLAQKYMIEECNRAGKPVITATQMLESMMQNPFPTRAEASDVANAIIDGTDAVMLSGETAVGSYPVEAARTMQRIAKRTEEGLLYEQILEYFEPAMEKTVTDAISYATCHTAQELGASAIITSTQSGYTARMVSKYRPRSPVIAVTPVEKVALSLNLSWGVLPVTSPPINNTDEMFTVAVQTSLEAGLISNGDLVVITAGLPVGVPGSTNLLRVETVGEVMASGTGLGRFAVTGKALVVRELADMKKVEEGDIVVMVSTEKEFVPYLEKTRGVVAEEGGLTSNAALVAVNQGIPAIVGVEDATRIVSDGEIITLDGIRGLLYRGRATVL